MKFKSQKKINPGNNFCVLPFSTILLRADSSISVCCYNTSAAKNNNGETAFLYRDALEDPFFFPFFSDLRKSMLANERHPSCAKCWADDDTGLLSKRKFENLAQAQLVQKVLNGLVPQSPAVLSLNLGNLCNLKCRICGPTSSSRWAGEYVELFGEDHIPRNNDFLRQMSLEESRALMTNWPLKTPDFADQLTRWWPAMRRVEFLGGEPLLNPLQARLVKAGADQRPARQQSLEFVTNGSLFPETDELNSWRKYRNVSIHVSVDGIGSQFEYQRFGANWEIVRQNILHYRKLKFLRRVDAFLTISIFNIYYLPEIYSALSEINIKPVNIRDQDFEVADDAALENKKLDFLRIPQYWLGNFLFFRFGLRIFQRKATEGAVFSSFVFNPERFDVRVLPKGLKESVARKFSSVLETCDENTRLHLELALKQMNSEDLSSLWPKTIESIWFHDKYRNQSFAETFPEFHQESVRLGYWFDYGRPKESHQHI